MTDDQAEKSKASRDAIDRDDSPAFVDRRRRGQRDWFRPLAEAHLPRPKPVETAVDTTQSHRCRK